jgi:hypothetical protein
MIVHNNITVGTTATLLFTVPKSANYTAISIQNRDSAAIYLGDSAITVASGANGGHYVAPTNGTFQLWAGGGDKVYAISSAGTSTGAVSVLYSYVPSDIG